MRIANEYSCSHPLCNASLSVSTDVYGDPQSERSDGDDIRRCEGCKDDFCASHLSDDDLCAACEKASQEDDK